MDAVEWLATPLGHMWQDRHFEAKFSGGCEAGGVYAEVASAFLGLKPVDAGGPAMVAGGRDVFSEYCSMSCVCGDCRGWDCMV